MRAVNARRFPRPYRSVSESRRIDAGRLPKNAALRSPTPESAVSRTAVSRTLRYYGLFAGAAYCVFIPFLIPAIAQAHSISAWWWTPTALICAALPGVLVGVHCLVSSNPLRLRRWAALGALGVLVAELLWWPAWNGTPLDDATVYWLGPFVVLGTICAMIAWKPAPAALYLIVCAVTIKVTGNVTQGVSSPATMITDAACSAAFAIVPFALGVSGLSIAATLDRNSAAEIALAEQTAATRARLAERALARAITHDEIMSTLLEASRDPESPELPSRATATLVALDDALRETTSGLNPEPAGVVGRLSEAAQHNDPGMTVSSDVRTSAGSTYPQSAVDALVGATAEAARNCFRHVPPECTRFCRILVEDHRIEVTIGDDGPGFDRLTVPRERLGLAMSVEERLRRVGGEAAVDSVPGRGTTLALGWHRPAEPVRVDDPDPLRLRSSTARVLAATIIVVLAVAAALNPGSVTWWAPVAIIAMMAVAVAFLVGGATDLLRPLPGLFVAAVPALMCTTYLFTLADTTQTIPLWVTGPPALMAALLAMRGRPAAAILGFAVALAVSGLWSYTATGNALPGILLIGPSGGFVAIGIVFARVNRTLARDLTDSRRRTADAAGTVAATRAAAQERARQLEPVTALARPLLLRLCSGGYIDDATRTECGLTEARLRDLLRSRALCTPDINDAVDAARRRGITVSLLDDRGLDRPDSDAPDPLDKSTRELIIDTLRRAADGAVRIRALPQHRTFAVSVVAEADDRCEWIGVGTDGRVRTTVTEMGVTDRGFMESPR